MAKKTISETNNYILDAISPGSISFDKDYYMIGGRYCKTLVLTKYPPRVQAAWMANLANMNNVICSMYAVPIANDSLLNSMDKFRGEQMSRANDNTNKQLQRQQAERAVRDIDLLLKQIDEEGVKVFDICILVTVFANDEKTLRARTQEVTRKYIGSSLRLHDAVWHESEAFDMVSPYCNVVDEIYQSGRHNMTCTTVAGMFPFTTSGIHDMPSHGNLPMFIGNDESKGIVMVNFWARGGDRTNSNIVLIGQSGGGKSTLLKKLLKSEKGRNTRIYVLDPEREYIDICIKTGGKWIDAGGKGGINILQIMNMPNDNDDDDEDENSPASISNLSMHFKKLRTFFKLYITSITDNDMSDLEVLLEDLYRDKNITWNTDTSTLKPSDFPVMKDLYNLVQERIEEAQKVNNAGKLERLERLSGHIRRMAIGADQFLFNGITEITADNQFTVIDINSLVDSDDSVKRAQYYNVLSWIWHQITIDRKSGIKTLLFIDEAHLLYDPNVPQTIMYLKNIAKRIRKYNGGMILATQSVVDFLAPEVRTAGQAILDNACYKILFGCDGKNLKEITDLYNLGMEEQELLEKRNQGHCLIMAGARKCHAIINLTDDEKELFGSGGGK
jgi:type IV secretory pathway VirB4 component